LIPDTRVTGEGGKRSSATYRWRECGGVGVEKAGVGVGKEKLQMRRQER